MKWKIAELTKICLTERLAASHANAKRATFALNRIILLIWTKRQHAIYVKKKLFTAMGIVTAYNVIYSFAKTVQNVQTLTKSFMKILMSSQGTSSRAR